MWLRVVVRDIDSRVPSAPQLMLEIEPVLTNKEKDQKKKAEEFAKAVAPVQSYAGDIALLAAPDRFVKEVIIPVPNFFGRLAVLEFLYVLPDALSICHRRLDTIRAATVEIKTSPRLATLLLDVVLPLGNTLNSHARKAVVRAPDACARRGPGVQLGPLPAGRWISYVVPWETSHNKVRIG